MSEAGQPVEHRVQEVLTLLADWGVREICLAAGARNIPIIKGVLASSGIRVWNFFEERSMAFFALGRIMETGRPVAVVTTSGTAAVELMPAVVEAYYQYIPLIALTADRPVSYRQSGAPQAIEQKDLFGIYASCLDLTGPSPLLQTAPKGPLQINLCLPEAADAPALGVDFPASPAYLPSPAPVKPLDLGRIDLVLLSGISGISGPMAAEFSAFLLRLGAPVLAEATGCVSGLDSLLLRGGEKALASLQVERVLRIGAVPSWRWWRDLEDRPEIAVLHFSDVPFPGLARDLQASVQPLRSLLSANFQPSPSMTLPVEAGQKLESTLARYPLSEHAWMRHLSGVIAEDAVVFLGNSLPIREWNVAGRIPASQRCFASRGTNGIDGIVSTFLGCATDAGEAWLIIGDLSALYDLAGPWIMNQLPPGKRRIVVINNGGGKIFSRVASLARLEERTRNVIENQHDVDFAAWAQLWKLDYRRVTDPEQLRNLPGNDLIIEVVPHAEQTAGFVAAF
jgi:2-succinyl-5-enolpyruvyl-6-hydroxy-3-cyclohexene-1-carboxylate synthase